MVSRRQRRAFTLLADSFDRALTREGPRKARQFLKGAVVQGIERVLKTPVTQIPEVRVIVEAVRDGRQTELVEVIAGQVQEEVRARRTEFLDVVDLGPDQGRCPFPPDVFLPDTPETRERWRSFLLRLTPGSRLTRDKLSGKADRIPFRNGVWDGDMDFAPGQPLDIPSDIVRLRGSLTVRSPVSLTRHAVAVRGDLHAPPELLRQPVSPLSTLGGDIHLHDSTLADLSALGLGPDQFQAWGLRLGRQVVMEGRRFALVAEGEDAELRYVLVERLGKGPIDPAKRAAYDWNGQGWVLRAAGLPPALGQSLRRLSLNLRRLYGLTDLLPQTEASTPSGLRLLGLYTGLLAEGLPEGRRSAVAEAATALATLAGLLEPAPDTPADKEARLAGLVERLEEAADGHLPQAQAQRRPRVQAEPLERDLAYLRGLGRKGVNADDLLVSAGRTLVFLNNVFSSVKTKTRVANMVAPLRNGLRGLLGDTRLDAVLAELLKIGETFLDQVRLALPDRLADIDALARRVTTLNVRTPRELIEEFRHADYGHGDAALSRDRRMLARLAETDMGNLDQLCDASSSYGVHHYDLAMLRSALLVSLTSPLRLELRAASGLLAATAPSRLVQILVERGELLLRLLPVYNAAIPTSG